MTVLIFIFHVQTVHQVIINAQMDYAFQQAGNVMDSLTVLIPLMKLVAVSFTYYSISLTLI